MARTLSSDRRHALAWSAKHARVERDPRACALCGVCDCTWAYAPPGLLGLRATPSYRCDECRPARGNPLVDEVGAAA